jgi:REP element-mobilizing transposase RayT
MARPLRIEYPGGFYHVTSRGNERKEIYRSRRDREKFLEYLESATARYGARFHAYCFMSNHYHLLLETLPCDREFVEEMCGKGYPDPRKWLHQRFWGPQGSWSGLKRRL